MGPPAQPRVLLVHPGGVESNDDDEVVGLIRGLQPDYELVVLMMEKGPLASAVEALGVQCRIVQLPGKRSIPRLPFAARKIAADLRGDGITLVHAHGTRAALLGTYLSRHLEAPLLWLIQNRVGHIASRVVGPSCDLVVSQSKDGADKFPGWLRDRVTSEPPSSGVELARRLERHYATLVDRTEPTPPAPEKGGAFASSHRVARNTLARSAGEIIAKLASIALYVVIARKLGSEQFGDFIFGLSLSLVVLSIAGFGTDQYVPREIARDRGLTHGLLSDVMVLKGSMVFALTGVLAVIVLIGPYDAETRLVVVLIGIGVGIEMLSATLAAVMQGYERMELGAIGLIVQRGVTALVGIVVLLAGGGLIAVAFVFAAGSLVGYVAYHLLMLRVVRPKFRPDRARWVPVLKAAAPIGVASLMFTVLLRLDASLISFFTGGDQREVGNYGAAWRLVDATMFIPWAFIAAMLPWLSRQKEEGELLIRGSVVGLKLLVAVLMPIGIGYAVFAPSLIELLYGPEFEEAILPLRLLGVMTVLYGINFYASSVLVARHRPGAFARGVGFVLVLNLGLNAVLIPAYGASGAAFAALLSGVVLVVYSVRQVWVTVGRFSLTRAFGGPLLGAAAMALWALLVGLPFGPAVVLSTSAYLLALLAFERTFFVNDFDFVMAAIRAFGRNRRGEPPVEVA